MDLRLSELSLEFELQERRREAEGLHVQMQTPLSNRIVAGLGLLLVFAGTWLQTVADRQVTRRRLALTSPDPCRGCAN